MLESRKNGIPYIEGLGNFSQEEIKKIEEKQVYSFKYTGQHGDQITSSWPTLETATKAKQKLEEQGYDVSKISSR